VFGGSLYFVENGGHCARSINLATTIVSTVAGQCGTSGYGGDGGSPLVALLNSPTAIAVDSSGRVFIADSGNKRIRMVSANGAVITTLVDFTIEGLSVIDLSFDLQSSYLYWVSSSILGRVNLAGQVTQVIVQPGATIFKGVSAVPGYAHLVSVIDSTNAAWLIDCLNVALATTLTEKVGTTGASNALSVAAIPGAILVGQSNGKFKRFYNLLPIDALTFSIFGADTIAVDFQGYNVTTPQSIIPKVFNAQNATCGFGINTASTGLSCPAKVGAPRGMSITQSTPASNTVYYANNAGHTIEQLDSAAMTSATVFGTRGMSGTATNLLNSPTSQQSMTPTRQCTSPTTATIDSCGSPLPLAMRTSRLKPTRRRHGPFETLRSRIDPTSREDLDCGSSESTTPWLRRRPSSDTWTFRR